MKPSTKDGLEGKLHETKGKVKEKVGQVEKVLEKETSWLSGAVYVFRCEEPTRQIMSRSAPLACFHCQASHNSRDSFQRLSSGRSEMSCRMKAISSLVMFRPR